MIFKPFYDEEDYMIVLKLINKMPVAEEDIERVRTRLLFLRQFEK